MADLTPVIKDSFLQFSGAVLQSRALPDSRDLMKPSARQIFYCLYTDNFVHEKPFQKTLKAIGSAFRVYLHGDASAEGVIMRAAQPFAMRYPLVEVEGSYGTLIASGSWGAPRYTSARLSELANYLFADIGKNVIEEWRDNYDNTEQYPMVLPSKGFYNLVNGSYGIGIGASSSVPQYNLGELNAALIKLLWNPDIEFDEIYCAPDFATGAILLNADEVKESHRNGQGAACKLRAVVNFDKEERCFNVTELPYMVYTETICKQLEEIVNGDKNPGIDRFNDLTGVDPNIKIYLTRGANPNTVLKYLFKNTSLQTYYGVNFTMLENGRYPRVYGWKELLQAHLDHEAEVYRRGYEYDLSKIKARLHIIEGLLKAIDAIDEVIKGIKESESIGAASKWLQSFLEIDAVQAKAILDIKLARLAHLEVTKLLNEKNGLDKQKETIENILADENLLKAEIEKGLREVASKFGDGRRTQILNVEHENDEPIEVKSIHINLTNKNNLFVEETTSLYVQRRGAVGTKFKMDKDEYFVSSVSLLTANKILLFSDKGTYYVFQGSQLPVGERIALESLVQVQSNEHFCALAPYDSSSNIIFVTKKGYVKRSSLSEYKARGSKGHHAITLLQGDEICAVFPETSSTIGLLTKDSYFLCFEADTVRATGRISQGVHGISLHDGDYVVGACCIPDNVTEICSVTRNGLATRTLFDKVTFVRGRNSCGIRLQTLYDDDKMADFVPLTIDQNYLSILSNRTKLTIQVRDIPLYNRTAKGVKSISLKDNQKVKKIIY